MISLLEFEGFKVSTFLATPLNQCGRDPYS
jgi:hypothetical protein